MSLDNTTLQNKLSGIKHNKLEKSRGKLLFENSTIKWFFLFITGILILCVSSFTIVAKTSQTYSRYNESKAELMDEILDFLAVSSELEENTILDSFTEKSLYVTRPVNSFFKTEWLIKSEINATKELFKEWKKTLDPLTKYEFSAKGLVPSTTNEKFTIALDHAFVKLPDLLQKTKKLIRNLWLYSILGLVSPTINTIVQKIKNSLKIIDIISQNSFKILDLLGHYSTQSVVLFNQNPGEARPTGGFIGSYISMSISQGELDLKGSQSIYYVSNVTETRILAHPISAYYKFPGVHTLHNLNFYPCFRDSAKLLSKEFEKSPNGFTINQLYMVTPDLLEAFLPQNLILDVPGVGVFNPKNLLLEIERITSYQAGDRANPKKSIGPIFNTIFDNLNVIFAERSTIDNIRLLLNSIHARWIQFFYKEDKINIFFESLGLSSNSSCQDKNPGAISSVVANVAGDKRQLITKNYYGISSKKNLNGHRITINYTQFLENPALLQRDFGYGGINFFGFQIPSSAKNIKIQSPDLIDVKAVREYYFQDVTDEFAKPISQDITIKNTYQSATTLDKGVMYQHPDGGLLVGGYMEDIPGESSMVVEFDIPSKIAKKLAFYPQPGQNELYLTLGKNTAHLTDRTKRQIQNNELSLGVPMVLK
jgi:hypothetical protein